MSRAANAGQMIVPSKNIFLSRIKQTNGEEISVISSDSLSNDSIHVNSPQPIFNNQKKIVSGALYLLYRLSACGFSLPTKEKTMPNEFWINIFKFTLGFKDQKELEMVGQYAVALVKPSFFSWDWTFLH